MTDEVMDNLIRLGKEVERGRIRLLIITNKYNKNFTFEDLIKLIDEEKH
jgi:hypothetical protein